MMAMEEEEEKEKEEDEIWLRNRSSGTSAGREGGPAEDGTFHASYLLPPRRYTSKYKHHGGEDECTDLPRQAENT